MKTDRVERLLKLIQGLESGRSYSVEQLSELVGASRRTVFRDLNTLARAGLQYTFDHDSKSYSIERTALLPPVTLSYSEALALMLAVRHMTANPVLPDIGASASAGLKLESILPPAIRDHLGPLLEQVEIRHEPASDSGAIRDSLPIVQSALVESKKLDVRYDSYYEGHPIDVILHPYRLAHIHRGWYLIAFTEGVDSVRTYKVERILSLKTQSETFTVDSDFSLDAYFGNAWLMIRGDNPYHVKIRFQKRVAGNVDEITWHKTQRTTFESDGSLLFEVDVDGVDEISWWVLGYGNQAEVLEPPELRELITERVESMCACYRSGRETSNPDRTEVS